MKKLTLSAILLTDAYKLSHHQQYPEGTSLVFSNFTPRGNKYAPAAVRALDGVVVFGVQLAIKKLVEHFDENFFFTEQRESLNNPNASQFQYALNQGELVKLRESAITPIKTILDGFFQTDYDMTHFEKLWDLGYLPLEIRALDEGTLCPIKVPMLTIYNTIPEFFWLPNFLETILSQFLWKPMTSATIALAYKKILVKWADKTNPEAIEFVNWQGHDFSMRGLDAVEATIASSLGHLTSFYGTDSMPATWGAAHYYNDPTAIMGSVPATEHSVLCAGTKEGELETFRRLLKVYPTGILSMVSDTWDLWNVCTEILPTLKDEILARDGKLVIRPDSGDPVDILCGTIHNVYELEDDAKIEYNGTALMSWHVDCYLYKGKYYGVKPCPEYDEDAVEIDLTNELTGPASKGVIELLWGVLGGTVNEQGYKVLDSHIGAIYGDSITTERAEAICARLEAKGFASTNVVFGIGSYTYQYNTRDTFGFAMKATYVEKTTIEMNGYPQEFKDEIVKGFEIFKDPITDDGLKKSAKGLLRVLKRGDTFIIHDQCTWDEVKSDDNKLGIVFLDGKMTNEVTLTQVRDNVNKLV